MVIEVPENDNLLPIMPSQAENLRTFYSDDLKAYEAHCQGLYDQNYARSIFWVTAGIVSGALTVAAGIFLEASALKYTVGVLGVISALAPAFQKLLRNGHKSEFYGRAVNDVHALLMKLPLLSTDEEFSTVLAAYTALRTEESLLSKEADNATIASAVQNAVQDALKKAQPQNGAAEASSDKNRATSR